MSAAQSVVDDASGGNAGRCVPQSRSLHPRRPPARARARAVAMPDRVRGAALFADISGFTPLTEALAKELGPQRGGRGADRPAEPRLPRAHRGARALRRPRHLLQRRRDHLLARRRRRRCARRPARWRCRRRWDSLGDVVTPAGMRVRLAMKVAVAVGAARRFLVGDPDVQRIDVLAGRLIDELAGAEHQAEKGEVVLDRSALEALGDRVEIREMRVEEDGWREFGVVESADRAGRGGAGAGAGGPAAGSRRQGVAAARHLRAAARRARRVPGRAASGVPGLSSASAASTTTTTTTRSTSSTASSARCSGFSPRTAATCCISRWATRARICTPCSARRARTRTTRRAPRPRRSSCARSRRRPPRRNIQIGITYGRLRSGTYGHKDRQTFTCLGDAVNLAARLMAKAPPGGSTSRRTCGGRPGDVFTWQQLSAAGR